ncbi:UxaA family hydrolase [Tepidanaerobacter sp. EBM-38]|uniref:UxaA family hydrolase n=1 Tax=Tepidanaerobacter sp. EBM-38 TaxID=1918496 RepID=UPI000ADD382C|nr:altronate dehydratase family protein [Tepidanaerobacter sp. EBM-38]
MKSNFIQIHPKDNVAVALEDVKKGCDVIINGFSQRMEVLEDISFGHKIALDDIKKGDMVIKYGAPIGHAVTSIKKGMWVHTHNVRTNLEGKLEYTYNPVPAKKVDVRNRGRFFEGYKRADGSVGTRNEIWIIPTVSCVNTTANTLAKLAQELYPDSCDGIFAYPHNAGCSQLGEDFEITQKILASIVHHPNAGGVLLLSLGCENNDFEHFIPVLGDYDPKRIKFLVTQDVEDEIEEGLRLIGEIVENIKDDKRELLPVSSLKIAFKCGGSDAFSGITANPLCGHIAETVTALGGSAILTEVPEMFGAETFLMNRADSQETFRKVVEMINSFKQYYIDHNQPIYENPSPGNKRGGITTLEEKSLGCIQKGGQATVTDTLYYGEHCKKAGLNLMIGPGNDSISITNLLSSGAQILLFTTGRGNPLGTAIPTIKISTNTNLYNRKKQWIDFDAGIILENKSFEEAADELWDLIIDVASGRRKTKNEVNGYREIMIFKQGVIL